MAPNSSHNPCQTLRALATNYLLAIGNSDNHWTTLAQTEELNEAELSKLARKKKRGKKYKNACIVFQLNR